MNAGYISKQKKFQKKKLSKSYMKHVMLLELSLR